MSTQPDHATPTWRVISQVEQQQAGPTNQLVSGMRVSFVTGSGVTGSVFVPLANYTPDAVRTMIQDRAQILDQVQNLTGE